MGRDNRIWFRKDVGWWMVTVGGEKIRLAEGRLNKKLAEQKFHELAAIRTQSPTSPKARVADIIEKFLACNRPRLSAETMRSYDWHGQAFAEHAGYLLATELKPHHVTDFVSKGSWGPTTQYNARRSLFRIFSWPHRSITISMVVYMPFRACFSVGYFSIWVAILKSWSK
jgi:hypothetical protein